MQSPGSQQPPWAGQPQYSHPAPQYNPPGYGPAPVYYPQPRKRRTWLIVLLVLGIPVVLLILFVALGLAYNAMASEKPGNSTDKQLVLTAADLEPFIEGFSADASKERVIRRENIDQSWEVEYEYESDDLYIMSSFYRENSADDAKYTTTGNEMGSSIGFHGTGITESERNDLFKWGDASSFYLLENEGKPIGNRLVARKGNKALYIVFSGVYFADSQMIHELLDPLLQRIDAAK